MHENMKTIRKDLLTLYAEQAGSQKFQASVIVRLHCWHHQTLWKFIRYELNGKAFIFLFMQNQLARLSLKHSTMPRSLAGGGSMSIHLSIHPLAVVPCMHLNSC